MGMIKEIVDIPVQAINSVVNAGLSAYHAATLNLGSYSPKTDPSLTIAKNFGCMDTDIKRPMKGVSMILSGATYLVVGTLTSPLYVWNELFGNRGTIRRAVHSYDGNMGDVQFEPDFAVLNKARGRQN